MTYIKSCHFWPCFWKRFELKKNNVNWMDILRIAFTHAPEETREVFKRITNDDNLINELSKQLANNG